MGLTMGFFADLRKINRILFACLLAAKEGFACPTSCFHGAGTSSLKDMYSQWLFATARLPASPSACPTRQKKVENLGGILRTTVKDMKFGGVNQY